jgi:hypothetical protein
MTRTLAQKKRQLENLFRFQQGKCAICGKPADMNDKANPPVRFRIGSSYGESGCVRNDRRR